MTRSSRSFWLTFIPGLAIIMIAITLGINPIWITVTLAIVIIVLGCLYYCFPPRDRSGDRTVGVVVGGTIIVFLLVMVFFLPGYLRADASTECKQYDKADFIGTPAWYPERLQSILDRGHKDWALDLIESAYHTGLIDDANYAASKKMVEQMTPHPVTLPPWTEDRSGGGGQILTGSSGREIYDYYTAQPVAEILPNIYLSKASQKNNISRQWLADLFCLGGVCGTNRRPVLVVVGAQDKDSVNVAGRVSTYYGEIILVTIRGDLDNFYSTWVVFHEVSHVWDELRCNGADEGRAHSLDEVLDCGQCSSDRACYIECLKEDDLASPIDEDERLRILSEFATIEGMYGP